MRAATGDVVIAAMGAVTPLGLDLPTTWQALLAGKSGVQPIRAFDASGLSVRIAGGVAAEPSYVSALLQRPTRTKREQIAFRALDEAIASAALDQGQLSEGRLGIFTGCERENTNDLGIYAAYEDRSRDPGEVRCEHRRSLCARQPDTIARGILQRVTNAHLFFNYTMACAAGAAAIAEAVRWLRRGVIDRAIVLAADTPINIGAVHGFEELGALSTNNDAPEQASRPFDRNRDGFVLAEGAGALILETAEFARASEREPKGWVVGVGMTNNQYHITKTPPGGENAAHAMRTALRDAGLRPDQIGYINAHGTSTDVGDSGEVAAIRTVFSDPPPTSSTKSMTGHMVTASGIVELIIALMASRKGRLPPTINQEALDPSCQLDCIPNVARDKPVEFALSNSFGFGGTNVCLIVSGGRP